MTRKLLSTFFALVFGLTFILTAGVNAQTSSIEVSPYISTASPTHGINDMWDVQMVFENLKSYQVGG